MSQPETVELQIQRFNPDEDVKLFTEKHVIPYVDGITVLDALIYIYENIDSTLAFRWGCRTGQCGLCASVVDEKPMLTCLSRLVKGTITKVKPLSIVPVRKDLVTDWSLEFQKHLKVNPYLLQNSLPRRTAHDAGDRTLAEENGRCIECWLCDEACPVHKQAPEKFKGPSLMARLAFLNFHPRDGQIRQTSAVEEGLYECTTCLLCNDICPKDINIAFRSVVALRASAYENNNTPNYALETFNRLNATKRTVVQGESSFFSNAPEIVDVPDSVDEVVFFTGCMAAGLYPSIARDSVEVLRRNKVKVRIPKQQVCCGYPPYSLGNITLAKRLAMENIEIFQGQGVKRIVTPCSECAYTIGHLYSTALKPSEDVKVRLQVYTITDYLTSFIGFSKISREWGRVKVDATYHDSCYLNRGLHLSAEPRKLLTLIPGLTLREMPDSDVCSGVGGGLTWNSEQSSNALLTMKLNNATSMGASTLTVECPFCYHHLTKKAQTLNLPLKVKHTVELLAEAYGKTTK